MNGSLNTYENHLFVILEKLLKRHLLKHNQLKLKCHKIHKSEIVLAVLNHASYKIVLIFNIMWQELWRNCFIITNNISVVMIHVYVEISKNMHIFFVCINLFKGHVQNFKNISLARWPVHNSDSYIYGFGQYNFKEIFLGYIWKNVFSYVTNIASNIVSDTSIVSVSITSK